MTLSGFKVSGESDVLLQLFSLILELRTDLYLREPVFEVLEKYGIGQVLSHWTWLPPLRKQLAKAGGRFFNSGKQCVIRLLTPLGMRYDESYIQVYRTRFSGHKIFLSRPGE